jgi:pilus assembly protein CpaE
MTPPASLVLLLGQLGHSASAELLRSSSFSSPVVLKHLDWDQSFAEGIDELTSELLSARPSVICVGSGVPQDFGLSLTQEVFKQAPTVEVILIREPSAAVWAQASRLGARDVVDPNASISEFVTAIDAAVQRSQSLLSHVAAASSKEDKQGSVIVVLSPKGGSGKTTVSVNIAEAIAQVAPERTVLVDLDCQFGDVATALGLEPERTLTDLGALSELDPTALKLFLSRDSSGNLLVLPSSGTPDEADLIDEAKATEILRIVKADFDYVVVDTAAGIDERSLAAINEATDLLFVASMDVTSIRNLIKELDLLEKLGPSLQHRHFVLNRVDSNSGLKTKDIVDAVGLQISHTIDTSSLVVQRSNAGQSIVLSDPKSTVAKQLQTIAESFLRDSDRESKSRRLFRRGEK